MTAEQALAMQDEDRGAGQDEHDQAAKENGQALAPPPFRPGRRGAGAAGQLGIGVSGVARWNAPALIAGLLISGLGVAGRRETGPGHVQARRGRARLTVALALADA